MIEDATYVERLKWAAEQGSKNLGEKFTTGDNMNKEAQTTLTYVLVAMGATFAYAFEGLASPITVLTATAAVMCGFYTCLGIWLVKRTFLIGNFPSPYQEPQNLAKDPEVALKDVILAEINLMKERIDEANEWISRKSKAVNLTRKALVWSPVGFVIVSIGCRLTI
ncbi:MAG: hypothetical protein EOP06_04085 [Proteobacteria bacterium]|nr:MAG: hypothetical protein EOP06_04085 [Pseudomonadota bacterium]